MRPRTDGWLPKQWGDFPFPRHMCSTPSSNFALGGQFCALMPGPPCRDVETQPLHGPHSVLQSSLPAPPCPSVCSLILAAGGSTFCL